MLFHSPQSCGNSKQPAPHCRNISSGLPVIHITLRVHICRAYSPCKMLCHVGEYIPCSAILEIGLELMMGSLTE
ncbi:hypothetical protein B0O99DRAFT_633007 [Bisporella sp. PMI_857]|nr:hypothetical protein B0O99DRAFT_633007 [Bisporella sp. PMI_857]